MLLLEILNKEKSSFMDYGNDFEQAFQTHRRELETKQTRQVVHFGKPVEQEIWKHHTTDTTRAREGSISFQFITEVSSSCCHRFEIGRHIGQVKEFRGSLSHWTRMRNHFSQRGTSPILRIPCTWLKRMRLEKMYLDSC